MGFLRSIFSKKEKMDFNSFVYMVISVLASNKLVNIDSADPDGLLTQKEKEKIQTELEYFRIILHMFLLIDKGGFGNKTYTSEEIGKAVGLAYGTFYRNNGVSQEKLNEKMDLYMSRLEYYFNSIEAEDEEDLKKKDVYFFLCKYFSNYILDKEEDNFSSPNFPLRSLTAFDIAKQTYRSSEKGFNDLIKEIDFTN